MFVICLHFYIGILTVLGFSYLGTDRPKFSLSLVDLEVKNEIL